MVDIHSHILPNVDDGAKSWEIAIEMCRMAAADGITHMVASPHANDKYRYDRKAHEELLQRMREELSGAINLSLGCDFHFSFQNIRAVLRNPEYFLIGGTDYLLVELSDYSVTRQIMETLRRLAQGGVAPIITHPERNAILQRQPELTLELAAMGCAIQVTANSLTGFWGDRPRQVAIFLLEHHAVHVLATDAHDLKNRPPVLSKARDLVAQEFGKELAQALCLENPRAIVSGEPLPYFPEPVERS